MTRAGFVNNSHSTRLMKTPNVRQAIRKGLLERQKACQITSDKVLARLLTMLEANIGDFLIWNGTKVRLKNSKDIAPDKLHAISELSQGEMGGYKIKLQDKQSVIEKLMRYLGMFERSNQKRQTPDQRKAEILLQVRDGKMPVDEALLNLDAEGLPIPESIRILAARQKSDEGPPDDGAYAVISPEEMAAKADARRKAIEKQREEFIPQRQAEVQAIKDELGQGSFTPEEL